VTQRVSNAGLARYDGRFDCGTCKPFESPVLFPAPVDIRPSTFHIPSVKEFIEILTAIALLLFLGALLTLSILRTLSLTWHL
jgi:hypothetical protein